MKLGVSINKAQDESKHTEVYIQRKDQGINITDHKENFIIGHYSATTGNLYRQTQSC